MNYYSYIVLLFVSIFCISCKDTESETKTNKNIALQNKTKPTVDNTYKDCIEYVALWSAEEIAKVIGKDKKWVFLNYTVDIWDAPPALKKGKIVGKLRASSYAPIYETRETAYLVESPMGKVRGWLDKSHVKSTLWKNKKTKKICNQ